MDSNTLRAVVANLPPLQGLALPEATATLIEGALDAPLKVAARAAAQIPFDDEPASYARARDLTAGA
jgi:hypothetical protein